MKEMVKEESIIYQQTYNDAEILFTNDERGNFETFNFPVYKIDVMANDKYQ